MPHSTDATANQTTPTRKIRRRPNRSPRAPPTRSKPASVRVYAVTTHCSAASPVLKSRPMAGKAMPTTVASIEAMADPRTVAARTHRPRGLSYVRLRSSPDAAVGVAAIVALIPAIRSTASGWL
jgi:hypothetical protein